MSRSKQHASCLGENPTEKQLIDFWISNPNPICRCKAACALDLTIKQFALLSDDSDEYVRIALAKNPNTPPLVLAHLANDRRFTVRFWVARHQQCPTLTLSNLLNDPVDVVCMAVKERLENEPDIIDK